MAIKGNDDNTSGQMNDANGQKIREIAKILEKAKSHYRSGSFGEAANDFARVLEIEPDNTEAAEYLVMIEEIQSYRYTDLLNP